MSVRLRNPTFISASGPLLLRLAFFKAAMYDDMNMKLTWIVLKCIVASEPKLIPIVSSQCGTKPDMNGKFYENNIVIQYDKDLIEVRR